MFLAAAVVAFATLQIAMAGDSDIISDFKLPSGALAADGNFFTFTGLRDLFTMDDPKTFTVIKANMEQFPALEGQSVSSAALIYPPGSVNPLHTHPRASELLFVRGGCLKVGFVDSSKNVYTQVLHAGDMFLFPKGLVHYQYNADEREYAYALSAFGSANPATVNIGGAVFNSSIYDAILAKSFRTDVGTIRKIKAGFSGLWS